MLISKDIWALVELEEATFRAVQLHNKIIVINAFDFLHNIFRNCELDASYGGEYCQMKERLKVILSNYRRCKIQPIFVFGGTAPCTVSNPRLIAPSHSKQRR